MPIRNARRTSRRPIVRARLAAILGLTLLPIAAGIAGLATTDLALQTRANPPTMGALEAGAGASTPASPSDSPSPIATAPAAPSGLVVARFTL